MGFHEVHGENVRLEQGNKVARRAESFCKAIVFSSRPVQINEEVVIRLTELSNSWSGALRLGFTAHDPVTLEGNLPKYACPDLTNRPGNWAKALGERYAVQGTVLHYYVNATGEVFFGINGEDKGLFLNGVDTRGPLWALVDIYGNTTTIQILDELRLLNNHNLLQTNRNVPLPEDPVDIVRLLQIDQLSLNAGNQSIDSTDGANNCSTSSDGTELMSPVPASRADARRGAPVSSPVSLWTRLGYHSFHTSNARLLDSDRTVAERLDLGRGGALVFSSRTLRCNERLRVKVVGLDESLLGTMSFGLTTCDPKDLEGQEANLPEDPDALLDRPEYWVLHRGIQCSLRDEFTFVTGDDGRVQFSCNDGPFETVMYVDSTQQFFAFFDLCGKLTKLKLVGTIREAPVPSGAEAPILVQETSIQKSVQEEADTDCRICFESPIDSVLCNCGHSLTCHACGMKLLGVKDPVCPVCRQPILNVVRIYKA